MRKITDLHRLYWTDRTENYMFDGCLRSVLAALGEPQYNFDFFAALTGDFFTQMFDPARAVDSLTHDYFQPQMAEHAFSACGYGCTVLQGDAIATKSDQALARVRESVERGVPAIVRGLAGHDAFCLIGGYGDGETLFVNFWDDQTSADGYTPIETGLAGTTELILAGDKVGEPALGEVFHTILESIPKHLTRAPQGSCVFGRQAVMRWAEALLDEQNFTGSDEEIEARRAILHDAPLVQLVTNASGVRRFFARVNREHPELGAVRMLAPIYADILSEAAALLRAQDGFFAKPEKLRSRVLREDIAAHLSRLAALLDEVYAVFCE